MTTTPAPECSTPVCCGKPMSPAPRVGWRCASCRSWVRPDRSRVTVPPCPDCGEPMWSLAWRKDTGTPRRVWSCRNGECRRKTWLAPADPAGV